MSGIRNRAVNFFSGDFILTRGLDRQLGFIFFIFVIFCCIIFWSLMVESKLVKVAENEKKIKSLVISRDQLAIDLLGLDRRGCVEELLRRNNSKLVAPVEPAKVIEED